jgi:choline-sulfatase
MDRRPNILLVMTDQHSRGVAGCYGDPIVETPHLDELALRGVLFENSYCNFPLCGPSRMCFISGKYATHIECWDNGAMLRSDIPTFAHALSRAGYDTLQCGRMEMRGPDQWHGFARRLLDDMGGGSAGTLAGAEKMHVKSIKMSGPGKNPAQLYDKYCLEKAGDFLEEYAASDQSDPFCLVAGTALPHPPYVCPPHLFEKYFSKVAMPDLSQQHLEQLHPYHQRYRKNSEMNLATEFEIRRTRAAYYGLVEYLDQQVGALLQTLDKTGLRKNTLVIYTSDHGETAGQHGLFWKMSLLEGAVGVPLIFSLPGVLPEGVRRKTPVSLIDLAPTLSETGGAPAIPGVDGASLINLLKGEEEEDRAVFSELFVSGRLSIGPSGGPARMMRRGDWKCIYYHREAPQLFNLTEDPYEMSDRSNDPACQQLLQEMLTEILSGWNPEEVIASAKSIQETRNYVRATRVPPMEIAEDTWSGPRGYGMVYPIEEKAAALS